MQTLRCSQESVVVDFKQVKNSFLTENIQN